MSARDPGMVGRARWTHLLFFLLFLLRVRLLLGRALLGSRLLFRLLLLFDLLLLNEGVKVVRIRGPMPQPQHKARRTDSTSLSSLALLAFFLGAAFFFGFFCGSVDR